MENGQALNNNEWTEVDFFNSSKSKNVVPPSQPLFISDTISQIISEISSCFPYSEMWFSCFSSPAPLLPVSQSYITSIKLLLGLLSWCWDLWEITKLPSMTADHSANTGETLGDINPAYLSSDTWSGSHTSKMMCRECGPADRCVQTGGIIRGMILLR